MRQLLRIGWFALCTLALSGACAPNTLQHTATLTRPNIENISEFQQAQTVTGTSFPAGVNPLTGLVVENPDALMRRPIVVKVSNAPALVRPQAGLSQADLVFEHYAEGGLTRFSAIFYSQAPERVGSVRSARLIDHELVPMFDGILAFSGASIGVEKYIYGSEAVNAFYHDIEGIEAVYPGAPQPPSDYAERTYKGVLYGLPYYWRDEAFPVPHNLFVNLAALWTLAAQEGNTVQPHLTGFAFSDTPPPYASEAATLIDVRYRGTRVQWMYDAAQGVYLRTADGQAHTDATTGEQLRAENVVILHAEHTDTLVVESMWEGNPIWSIQIAVWGENDATLFRDGKRYEGRWSRTVREAMFAFTTTTGEVLLFKPGHTWFEVMPSRAQMMPDSEWVRSE